MQLLGALSSQLEHLPCLAKCNLHRAQHLKVYTKIQPIRISDSILQILHLVAQEEYGLPSTMQSIKPLRMTPLELKETNKLESVS